VEFTAMASPCRIRLAGVADEAQAQALAQAAVDEVRRIEQRYSRYRPDSIVSRINAAAGSGRPVPVDAETAQLLDFADLLYRQSEGRFDLSSGVLRQAWDFKAARVPSETELARCRERIGWDRVVWTGEAIALPRAGMEIDFGGIGKEYAVDRAATLLLEAGVRSGLVNLGGDLRVLGPHPDGRPWRLGVAHARARRGGAGVGGARRRPGHQRRLRALLRAGWPALLPHPGPAHRLAGVALAVGHGGRAVLPGRRRPEHAGHAGRAAGAGLSAIPGRGLRRPGPRGELVAPGLEPSA
jgi:thiamine biosynthesis lipoprotein